MDHFKLMALAKIEEQAATIERLRLDNDRLLAANQQFVAREAEARRLIAPMEALAPFDSVQWGRDARAWLAGKAGAK